jgi:hypothetical protein
MQRFAIKKEVRAGDTYLKVKSEKIIYKDIRVNEIL